MRALLRSFAIMACLSFSLLLPQPLQAQSQNPSAQALQQVSERLDAKQVVGLFRVQRTLALLPLWFRELRKLPAGASDEQILQALPMQIRVILQMSGVDLTRGAVISVHTSSPLQPKWPFDVAVWLWLQRADVLSQLLGMMQGKQNNLLRATIDAKREIFLYPSVSPRMPGLFAARDGKMLVLRPVFLPKPSSFPWWNPDFDGWTQTFIKENLRLLEKSAKPLSQHSAYQNHLKNFGPAQIALLLRFGDIFTELTRRWPTIQRARMIQRRLKNLSWGLQVSNNRISFRELFRFNKPGNPVTSLLKPRKSPASFHTMLPAHTVFFSQATIRFARLKPFILRIARNAKVPKARIQRALQEFEAFQQRFISHLGITFQKDILAQLSGQIATALLLHKPQSPPFLTNHDGLVLFVGLQNAGYFSKTLSRLLADLRTRQVLQYKTLKIQNTTVYQLPLVPNVHLFLSICAGHLLVTSDLLSTKQIIAQQNKPASSFATQLKKYPFFLRSLQQGAHGAFLDSARLRPWLLQWDPAAFAARFNKRASQGLSILRSQLLRAPVGYLIAIHHADSIEGLWRGWLREHKGESAPPQNSAPFVPYFLANKKLAPLWGAYAFLGSLPALATPTFAGLFGAGVVGALFWNRAVKVSSPRTIRPRAVRIAP